MKGIVYRFAALALACMVALSALAVPSFAVEYTGQDTFWNWAYNHDWFLGKAIIGYTAGSVCTVSSDAFHHASTYQKDNGNGYYLCICEECGQEFKAYASDLQSSYENLSGFKQVSSDGLTAGWTELPFNWSANIKSGQEEYGTLSTDGDTFTFTTLAESSSTTLYVYIYFTVPANCNAITSNIPVAHSCGNENYLPAHYVSYYYQSVDGEWVKFEDDSYDFEKGVQYRAYCTFNPCCREEVGVSETYYTWHKFYVNSWDVSASQYLPTNITRVSSVSNNIGFVNNGNIDMSETSQIVDETNMSYYNPVTNTTTNITNWTYDYSDRSYTCTTENNTTTTITYGDEFITINEGDVNNTYITYNIYYYTAPEDSGDGSGSGSDDSGDSDGSGSDDSADGEDDGSGLLDAIGEFFGVTLGGLVRLISAALNALLDALIDLVSSAIERLTNVVDLFGSFGDALGILWSWLPEEVVTVLVSGVTVIVFASVIKLFMR